MYSFSGRRVCMMCLNSQCHFFIRGEVVLILYLIRHGQSVANESGIIQGCKEFPLSKVGEKQAELLGDFFATKSIDLIYSSDLMRAFETAKAIGAHHPIEVTKFDKIREIGLGPLEGKTREEIYLKFPEIKDKSILTTGLKGTETVQDITVRCQSVLEHLQLADNQHNIALVSHGGFISIFLMYLMFGKEWNEFHRPFIIGNTGVTKIEFRPNRKPIFHYINRDAHLLLADMQSGSLLY